MNRASLLLLLFGFVAVPAGQLDGQVSHRPQAFAIRGVLPWHNFLSGPSAWNLNDYEKYLDDCKDKQINFIGFHCYTGGGQRYVNYVEPLIKIRYKNILPEAYLDNSLTARWGYEPLAIQDFAFNSSTLYSRDANAFGSDCSIFAANTAEHYTRTQRLMKQVMVMAHARGMQTAMGFEFGVHPPELFSLYEDGLYWEGTGSMIPNPTHYQAVEILYATIDNILETYPDVDWIWLWLNEHSFLGFNAEVALKNKEFKLIYDRYAPLFEGKESNASQKLVGVWALQYIKLAYDYIKKVAPGKGIVIGGWGGSNQLPPILRGLDKGLPRDIMFSCLNPGMGQYPQPEFIADIATHRKFWSIPWLEGDHQLWHYQPRVKIIREQVKLARTMNLDGVIAIHWRTEEVKANFATFSRLALDPDDTATVEQLYADFLEMECGKKAAADLAPYFQRFDEEMWLAACPSPEYYCYTPDWGRLDTTNKKNLNGLLAAIKKCELHAPGGQAKQNLRWFGANVEFMLLLDAVGRKLEPAYMLQKKYYGRTGGPDLTITEADFLAARKSLDEAPLQQLFSVFESRVRSRGELGELSSMNQKLFNEYKGLKTFLLKASAEK